MNEQKFSVYDKVNYQGENLYILALVGDMSGSGHITCELGQKWSMGYQHAYSGVKVETLTKSGDN